MALTHDIIVDYRPASDRSADPAYHAANSYFYQCISPNDRYLASIYFSDPTICVTDLQELEVVQNYNVGFIDLGLVSSGTLDGHLACIDNAGSVWTADGDGSGKVYELPLGEIDLPQYRFTLTDGDGGDVFWFSVATAFAMPGGGTKVVFVERSDTDPIYDYHVWDKDTETYTREVLTWMPKCAFQDDNGDIWLCGITPVVGDSISTVEFKRITSISSEYPALQTFEGLPEMACEPAQYNKASLWGCFESGFFIGGWGLGGSRTSGNIGSGLTAFHLIKLNLNGSETSTSSDIATQAPDGFSFVIPSTYIPPNPGFISLALRVELEDPLNSGPPFDGLSSLQRKFYFFSATTLALGDHWDLGWWDYTEPFQQGLGDQYLYTLEAFTTEYTTLSDTEGYPPDQQFGIIWLWYLGDAGEGDGDEDVEDDSPIIRVWSFSLDGHDFYVVRLGTSCTLVYDLTTDQWAEWASPDRDNWRAHIGCNWVGMSADTVDRGFGTDVVAGDDVTGTLWVLDPTAGRDDRATTGSEEFTRKVMGLVTLSGRKTVPCGAVQATLALGEPSQSGATITLRTSDDLGQTWLSHGSQEIVADSYSTVIEWRALGLVRQPGRLFELSDDGATVRIGRADMR